MTMLAETKLERENAPASPSLLCPGGCKASALNKRQCLLFINLRRKQMAHSKGLSKRISERNIYKDVSTVRELVIHDE